jgi:hypothetical protein
LNALIFGGLAIISLFIFFNLGKMKASSKQLNRNNRINRFGGQQNTNNIIEGESKEITDEDKN